MRGGTASIFEKRQFTANNRQMNETFNASEDTTYGFMVDANNLYGGVMQTRKLPASRRDYPLASTKAVVQKDWLSRYQKNVSEQIKNNENSGPAIGKVKKLLQVLHDKTQYIKLKKLNI